MGEAKEIRLEPIASKDANRFVKKHHYSGKVVNNSQLHIGVFFRGALEGVMSFGPSLDKRKIVGLVEGTGWNEFMELNRLAFTDRLPRNSESRALSIAFKLIRKHLPHIKWIISFADATQCGDGTIYRAAGFVLTSIKRNNQIWAAPDGEVTTRLVATDTRRPEYYRLQEKARTLSRGNATKGKHIIHTVAAPRGYGDSGGLNLKGNAVHSASLRPGIGAISTAARTGGGSSMKAYIEAGFKPLEGYQLRYIYFLDPTYRARLTVPEIPFSKIDEIGAGMYKGKRRAAEVTK